MVPRLPSTLARSARPALRAAMAALLLAGSSPAFAAVIFSQPPNETFGYGSDVETNGPIPDYALQICADDFVLGATTSIAHIRAWGAFDNDTGPPAPTWRIEFRPSNPAGTLPHPTEPAAAILTGVVPTISAHTGRDPGPLDERLFGFTPAMPVVLGPGHWWMVLYEENPHVAPGAGFDNLDSWTWSVRGIDPPVAGPPSEVAAGRTDWNGDDPNVWFQTTNYQMAFELLDAVPPATGTVGDLVWHDLDADGFLDGGEPGLSGVAVTLLSGVTPVASTMTNGSGNWSIAAAPGSYTLRYERAGYNTVNSSSFSISSGVTDNARDAGLYQNASVGDLVWHDLDGDGQIDGGEPGISGVTVRLFNGAGTTQLASTTTNGSGIYSFSGRVPGSYLLEFVLPSANHIFTRVDTGADATDSDANVSTGRTAAFALTSGQNDTSRDAGMGFVALTVNNTGDGNDGNIANGTTTLREAVVYSNNFRAKQTIGFVAPAVGTTIPVASTLNVTDTVDINGPGMASLTVDGGDAVRVFQIGAGVTARIFDLSVANGVGDEGGGLRFTGTSLELARCAFQGNTATGGLAYGGAVALRASGAAATATLTGCVFLENHADREGGGVAAISLSAHTLGATLDGCTFDGNTANNYGGGMTCYAQGGGTTNLQAVDCTFTGNSAGLEGGGLDAVNLPTGTSVSAAIRNSTFDDNQSSGNGGGLNLGANTATVDSCTIGNNLAVGNGGGLHVFDGSVSILRSTISGNTADSDSNGTGGGGGISRSGGTCSLSHTIVAGNFDTPGNAGLSATLPDIQGTLASSGFNLIGNEGAATLAAASGDQIGTAGSPIDAVLAPLADNGGPTMTFALLGGSPAVDGGDPAFAPPPATDQRGAGFPRVVGARIDIGAFEADIPASIGDLVWEDVNGNGRRGAGEPGIEGVLVELLASDATTVLASTSTDASGLYSFPAAPGSYLVRVTPPDGFEFTTANNGAEDVDSDVLGEGSTLPATTDEIVVSAGDVLEVVDAGLFRRATVAGFAWSDFDRDGEQDGGEPGVEGVRVDLRRLGSTLATTYTDENGEYLFENVRPNPTHYVRVWVPDPNGPALSTFGPPDAAADGVDNDVDVATMEAPANEWATTANFAATSGASIDRDAGLVDLTDPYLVSVDECPGECSNQSPVEFALIFSEPVFLLESLAGDDNVDGIGTGAASTPPSTTWNVNVTAVAEGPLSVWIPAGAFADPSTNAIAQTAVCSWTHDVTAPELECGGELALAGPSISSFFDVFYTVTFTEDVSDLDADDFSGTAQPHIVDISPAGPSSSYLVQATLPMPGTYTLNWNLAATVVDCAGNAFAAPEVEEIVVEVVEPAVAAPATNMQFAQFLPGAGGDRFGASVALSGETALIGGPSADPLGLSSAGAVWVAEHDGAGSHPLVQILSASDAAALDAFGTSVDVSGDLAIVGAPFDDAPASNSGSAYLFARDGSSGTWSQLAKLVPAETGPNWNAGFSAAIDGNTAVVGVPYAEAVRGSLAFHRSGRVVVFEFDACAQAWEETAVLTASDAATYDFFGTSVDVAGGTILVGAPGDDDFGGASGAVYAFQRVGGVWVEEAKLAPAGLGAGDNLGTSVAMRGDLAVLGVPGDDDEATNAGGAWAMRRDGPASWSTVAKLTAADGALGDQGGTSVATDGVAAVVGAPQHDQNGGNSGTAWTFDVLTGTQTGELLTAKTNASDLLGSAVAVDGSRVLVGSPTGAPGPGFSPTLTGTPGTAFFHLTPGAPE